MWIEVIHESNVDNDVKMTYYLKPILSKSFLQDYGLNKKLNKEESIINYITRFSFRFIKQIIRRIKNKIKKRRF